MLSWWLTAALDPDFRQIQYFFLSNTEAAHERGSGLWPPPISKETPALKTLGPQADWPFKALIFNLKY